jgi:hypothetical protein
LKPSSAPAAPAGVLPAGVEPAAAVVVGFAAVVVGFAAVVAAPAVVVAPAAVVVAAAAVVELDFESEPQAASTSANPARTTPDRRIRVVCMWWFSPLEIHGANCSHRGDVWIGRS